MRWSPKAIAVRLALVLVAIIASLIIGEFAVRLLAPQPLIPRLESDWAGLMTLRPSTRGRHLVPGQFDETYTINSDGFRNNGGTATGHPSIICLGDSFTFGIGAADSETFPAQLQRMTGASVLNAGLPGTGTGEQCLVYKYRLAQFHPRVLILGYHNDGDDDASRGLFVRDASGVHPRPLAEIAARGRSVRRARGFVNRIPGYTFLALHSQLMSLVRQAGTRLLKTNRDAPLASAAPPDVIEGEIEWLRNEARASEAMLVIVYLPDTDNRPSEGEHRRVRDVCMRHAIPFIDTSAALQQHADDAPLFYSGLDKHPTPAGYKVIAGEIAHFLTP
jgi:lysophospholipase L1-like esterase